MKNKNNYEFLLEDISKIKGVGKKTLEIFKKKKINCIFDLLWKLPQSYSDRTQKTKINELQIGKIHTLKVFVKKYSFPRIRNLPNRVICEDETGSIDCIFFNSDEGYIKQIFILTHNVYFFKEVTFNSKRSQEGAMNEETFWTVNKPGEYSKVFKHDTNPIKTSYELLWNEIKSGERSKLSIQNTMRRILENYFKILGNTNFDTICDLFDGKEKLICKRYF